MAICASGCRDKSTSGRLPQRNLVDFSGAGIGQRLLSSIAIGWFRPVAVGHGATKRSLKLGRGAAIALKRRQQLLGNHRTIRFGRYFQ